MSDLTTLVLAGVLAGLASGLVLLARGVSSYGQASRVEDTSTSRIATLAVGEVRISGVVEPAELTLTSALQSRPCVYYHSKAWSDAGRSSRTVLDDERALGFRVRDESGAIRLFPRGAAWDVPTRFRAKDGALGEQPFGLARRLGPATRPTITDREAAIADLLTVRPAGAAFDTDGGDGFDALAMLGALSIPGRLRYSEARIEPGETITIVATALPFDQLPDPDAADSDASDGLAIGGPMGSTADPEIAADVAAARAAGILETDPEEAWGNAAIPGFGIGVPIRPPELHPDATPPPLADGPSAERFARIFDIAPTELVLASSPDHPMLIAFGPPVAAVERGRDRFLLGLVGAVIAIASAVVLALVVGGTLRL